MREQSEEWSTRHLYLAMSEAEEKTIQKQKGGDSITSDDMKEPKSTQNLTVPIVFDRIPATGTKQLNPKGAIVQ